MFSSEVKSLLIEVITSWQVIAATIAVIFFIFLVNSAARPRRKKAPPPVKVKAKKEVPAPAAAAPAAKEGEVDDSALGLDDDK